MRSQLLRASGLSSDYGEMAIFIRHFVLYRTLRRQDVIRAAEYGGEMLKFLLSNAVSFSSIMFAICYSSHSAQVSPR